MNLADVQKVFLLHCRAIRLLAEGAAAEAEAAFVESLNQVADLVSHPDFRCILQERAKLLPLDSDQQSRVVEEFRLLLPRWLLELHQESGLRAFEKGELALTKLHVRILESTRLCAENRGIAMIRSEMLRPINTKALQDSAKSAEAPRVLAQLERVLAADSNNWRARALIRDGYRVELSRCLSSDSSCRQKRDPLGQKCGKTLPSSRRRKGLRLGTARLPLHLLRLREPGASQHSSTEPRELGRDYALLSLAARIMGRRPKARRWARVALALAPDDPTLRKSLRHARKRR